MTDKSKTMPDPAASASGRISVTCPSGPRRRAGVDFGPLPVELDPAALSPEARAAIEADPRLVIRQVS